MNVRITTINQLRILTQAYENLWNQSGYDPRTHFSPRRFSANELQVQYFPNQSTDNSDSLENSVVDALNNPISNRGQMAVCWNCRDMGHYYQDCPQDLLHVFCFGCGKDNTKKYNCLYCNKAKSENLRANFSRTGLQSSNQPYISRQTRPTEMKR